MAKTVDFKWKAVQSPSWDIKIGDISDMKISLQNGSIVVTHDLACGDDQDFDLEQALAIYTALGNCLRAAKKIK